MKKRLLINSCVITSEGIYAYRKIDIETAKKWLDSGEFVSYIGYQDTAKAMESLFDRQIAVNRTVHKMEPRDEALVFRLVFPEGTKRLPTDSKGKLDQQFILSNCEIGLLKRLSELSYNCDFFEGQLPYPVIQ